MSGERPRDAAERVASVVRLRAVLEHVQTDEAERGRLLRWLDDVGPGPLAVSLTTTVDELTWWVVGDGDDHWVRTGRSPGSGVARTGPAPLAAATDALPHRPAGAGLRDWADSEPAVTVADRVERSTEGGWASVTALIDEPDRVEALVIALSVFDHLGIAAPPDEVVGALSRPTDTTPLRARVATTARGLASVGVVSGPILDSRLVALIEGTAGRWGVEQVAAVQGLLGATDPTEVEVQRRPDGVTARLTWTPGPTA